MTASNHRRGGDGAGHGWAGVRADLIAGLTVAAVAVPQAMAYALIAGVEPKHGLYTAVVMTALGSLFGSSAHLINGPTNAISLVVLGAVSTLHLAPDRYHQAVFALTLLVGIFQILVYFLKLGDLTRYVSESVVLGFMFGAGVLVALSQVPDFLGIPAVGGGEHGLLWRLARTLSEGTPQRTAVLISVGTIAVVVGLTAVSDRLRFPLPGMLIALILASVAAYLIGWKERPLEVPPGLPGLKVPELSLSWVRALAGSAMAIALLGLLEALAIAKSIAARTRQPLDYNGQCLAEGLANLGGGFFQCMPGSGSLTRSAINYQAGAVTRWSGVVAAAAVAITLLLFADLARYVPRPALAGILMVTAWRLIDRPRLLYCLRASRYDALLAVSTAIAAVFISIEFSILIGVFMAFLFFVPRASRVLVTEFYAGPDRVIRERHQGDPECGRLAILGLEGELFFGAAPELGSILNDLRAQVASGVRVIVLRVKRARNPDMVCLEMIQHFLEDMNALGVPVLLCGVRADLAAAMERLGFERWLPADRLFLEKATHEPRQTSTLRAVKRAYELLGEGMCLECPRRQEQELVRDWSYMI